MERVCYTARNTFIEYQSASCLIEQKNQKQLSQYSHRELWYPKDKKEEKSPLVILLHGSSHPHSKSMFERRDFWLEQGYAVMLLNSFNNHRVMDYCFGTILFCTAYQNDSLDLMDLQSPTELKLLSVDAFKQIHNEVLGAIASAHYLLPATRAADLYIALDHASKLDRIDPENIHLIGYSHGGSAILDALALAQLGEIPPPMTQTSKTPLSGVRSASVYYPNCTPGTYIYQYQSTPKNIPVFMALARDDEFANPRYCERAANAINFYSITDTSPISSSPLVTQKYYPGEHAFDMQEYLDAYNSSVADQVKKDTLNFVSYYTATSTQSKNDD